MSLTTTFSLCVCIEHDIYAPVLISTVTFTSPESHPLELFDVKAGFDCALDCGLRLGFRVGLSVTGASVGAFEGRLLGFLVGSADGVDSLVELISTPLLFASLALHLLFEPHLPEQQKTSSPPALKQSSPAGWHVSDFLFELLVDVIMCELNACQTNDVER